MMLNLMMTAPTHLHRHSCHVPKYSLMTHLQVTIPLLICGTRSLALEGPTYDRFGNVDLGEDLNEEGTTRAEIEANLHDLIKDKLVDSVIEYHIDGEIFHRHLGPDDEDCDWGEWRQVVGKTPRDAYKASLIEIMGLLSPTTN